MNIYLFTYISSSFDSDIVKINLPSFQVGSFGAHHNLGRFSSMNRENAGWNWINEIRNTNDLFPKLFIMKKQRKHVKILSQTHRFIAKTLAIFHKTRWRPNLVFSPPGQSALGPLIISRGGWVTIPACIAVRHILLHIIDFSAVHVIVR
jgi:hypothetical protein